MKKFLSVLLAVALVCSLAVPALAEEDTTDISLTGAPVPTSEVTATAATPSFPDVPGHWAEKSIDRWSTSGIVQGDELGNMNPNKLLTRGEFAEMLVRLLGLKAKAANRFADLQGSEWYADSILKVAQAGIMLGDELGNCNAKRPISRQETMVMFARAMGLAEDKDPDLSQFSDGADVADWAAGYIAPLAKMGIVNGVVPGEMVAAPKNNINRASVLTLLDKAIKAYITEAGEYAVNEPNGFVVVNVAASQVTVSGEAAGVVVTAGSANADVTVKDMAADTLRVDAAGADVTLSGETAVGELSVNAAANVVIEKDAAVEDLNANAAAQIVNNGEVTNLNTNADGVTFDGNAPETVNTAVDVEAAKDSDGKEVVAKDEEEPSSGSTTTTRPTSYKYKVKVESATGGKVTASLTQTNKGGETVTLTVTPNAQTEDEMPYVLQSLTVKNGEKDVTVTDNKFTMNEEGTYTVTAVFEQPITKAVMYVADGGANNKTAQDMVNDGYFENDVTDAILAEYPYFFVGMTKNTDEGVGTYTISDFKITANGKNVDLPRGWGVSDSTTIHKFFSAYVGSEQPSYDTHDADKLNLTGSAYTFVLTFKVDTAEYKLTYDYVKPGVEAKDLKTVTFQTDAGDVLATYKAGAGDTVAVPAHPEREGYYFTGWDNDADEKTPYTVTKDVVVTASYVQITDTTLKVREDGPEGSHEGLEPVDPFKYEDVYASFGLTFKKDTITVDATELTKMVNSEDAAIQANLDHIKGNGDLANTVVFGVAYQTPDAKATQVAFASTLEKLPTANNYRPLATHPSCYNNTLISYIPVATIDPVTKEITFEEDGDSDFCKWADADGNVVAVTKTVINVKIENIPEPPAAPTYTVTFKNGSEVVKTETVEAGATVAVPEEILTAEGKGFLGWYVGTTEYDPTAPITADTEVTAKWTQTIPTTPGVAVPANAIATALGITTKVENGVVTITIPADVKAKFDAMTEAQKKQLNHEDKLYMRVNSDVPTGANGDWFFQGSTDNGLTWRAKVAVTKEALGSKGINVTEADGAITAIGHWFSFATVDNANGDNFALITPAQDWTIIYRWTNPAGEMQYTTYQVKFVHAEAEENP